MVELVKGLHVIDGLSSGNFIMNPVAVVEGDGSVHLVDCGIPGSGEKIFSYLQQHVRNAQVRTLILTHFDSDHVGSAVEVKKRTGCEVMAHEFDAKVIAGKRFTDEELREALPDYDQNEIKALQEKIGAQTAPRITPDRVLQDNEQVGAAGGSRVIHVPGHTPGHIVLFVPRLSALISGDTLTASEGRVGPPAPQYTPSSRQAVRSLKRLSGLDFEVLVPYHGQPVTKEGSKALRRYLDTLG